MLLLAGTAVPGAAPASSSAGEPLRPIPSRYTDISRVVERPYFDDISPRNVTAIVGQSAILNCRVKHLGDRTVSYKDLYHLSFQRIYVIKKRTCVNDAW